MTPLGIEPASYRIVALWHNQLRYLLINCTIGKEMYFIFFQQNYALPCSQCPPIARVLLSIAAGHNLISLFFIICINTIVFSTHISSKFCLCCRYCGYNFVCLFIDCHSCHKLRPSLLRYNKVCR
jgi:hypothetical protein